MIDTNIKITCGTFIADEIDFDIDCICKPIPTGADEKQQKRALALLVDTMDDMTFADDGCRNDDAVNGCIALHVLGYDPELWFYGFFDRYGKAFHNCDISKFKDHVNRVSRYLSKWGPEGDEGRALDYAL